MYKEFFYEKPSNENAKIWRYVDYQSKFVNLLETSSLYFRRADLFDDTLEGIIPQDTFDMVKKSNMRQHYTADTIEDVFQVMENVGKASNFVNCWHLNELESNKMWNMYTKEKKAVVIQSTFKKLTQCFETGTPDILIGKVNYVDHEKISGLYIMQTPFFLKDLRYKEEMELRCLITESINGKIFESLKDWKNGTLIKVNLDTLIEKIYVSPQSPKGFKEEVKAEMNKFNIDKPIELSGLKS